MLAVGFYWLFAFENTNWYMAVYDVPVFTSYPEIIHYLAHHLLIIAVLIIIAFILDM